MESKLARYAEGLMEAAWLAALIIVPVFFNVYSSRIFEPDKIALLRSLALLGLGAWVLKILENGRAGWGRLRQGEESVLRSILRIPMVPAVLALALVYAVSTILSISPRISLLGSYQRLQGTYTTFSYLILFAMVAVNLRRPSQINRLVNVVLLSSLAISLYAVLQRYEIDPIGWGGDTTTRVAANLGNAIFISAYLIMAFPLTLGRIVDAFTQILDEQVVRAGPHIARGVVYVVTAVLQIVAIYFSLSRGPILGLLAGTFFMFVLLSLYWGKRWLTLTTVGTAGALGVFLIVFSVPGGPFDSLRSNENIGRLGNVFDTDSGTGRVRVLIWEGASQLTWFHEPLEFPDGEKDTFNFLRPLLGYGPETMYVAFNPFYPPELGSIESRNSTPDRSHNETWDALVITGWLGLAAEQLVFMSVFYFGLKWLGLIRSGRQSALFFGLTLGGGLLSTILFAIRAGTGFIGVGLPFGILLGLLAYLASIALFSRYDVPVSVGEKSRSLTLMMFVGAIIAHYVEIHFGIAIAATRAHFWVYYGVLLAAGYWMTLDGRFGAEAATQIAEDTVHPEAEQLRKTERSARRSTRRKNKNTPTPEQKHAAWTGGVLSGILLATLSYNYLSNTAGASSIGTLILNSMTALPDRGRPSFGILSIFLLCWIAASVVASTEWSQKNGTGTRYVLLASAGIAAGIWVIFSFLHAGALIGIVRSASSQVTNAGSIDPVMRQVGTIEGLLSRYYVYILILLLAGARSISGTNIQSAKPSAQPTRSYLFAGAVAVSVIFFSSTTNLRTIQADMTFKVADTFIRGNNPENWRAAVEIYKRAIRYVPQQDHYYLFLGRGYLELTRLIFGDSPQEAQDLLRQAEIDLKRAQQINPLNTDHTANIARLYRFWSDIPGSDTGSLLLEVESYYRRALVLSPYNSGIWNEYATFYLQKLDDPETGLAILAHSLEIDPFNDSTYAILGDFYSSRADGATDEVMVRDSVDLAAAYYREAIERSRNRDARYRYAAALGSMYMNIEELDNALDAFFIAYDNASTGQLWQIEDTIAKVYAQMEEYESAVEYAHLAHSHAPEEQKEIQLQLLDYILSLQNAP